jgi:hypothetical protein
MRADEHWPAVKSMFGKSFKSSFHYAIATVNENGEPHVTPIGSLILGKPGYGLYFEEFTRQMPLNLQKNKQVCVLAVNSDRWFWIKSLFGGHFTSAPALRLRGTVGEARQATALEIRLWQNRVRHLRFTKGHKLIWANMKVVREIEFSQVEPVNIGLMTRDVWPLQSS